MGVSEDGENWVFVNGSTDIKKVKEILPDLPDNLQVPKTEAPAVRKASERVKAMVEELMKVEGEAWADSKPARELVGLGLASVENGLLEMLIDLSLPPITPAEALQKVLRATQNAISSLMIDRHSFIRFERPQSITQHPVGKG